MFIRIKTTPNSPRQSVQIVSSIRKGDKVSQRIVRHIGVAFSDDELEQLKVLAQQIMSKLEDEENNQLPLFSPESLGKREATKSQEPLNVDMRHLREEQRVIEGVHEIGGALFHELGFDTILGGGIRNKKSSEVLKDVVLARLAQPVSKLRTARLLEEDFGMRISVDQIYRMMDRLTPRIDSLKEHVARQTFGVINGEVEVLLYDVTTLAFESQSCDELRNFGYSKDKKFNEVQIVLALATTQEGMPVWYDVFDGRTAETKTLVAALKELRTRFLVKDVICVADRAMLSTDNIKSLEENGFRYVIGKRLRTMSKTHKDKILDLKLSRDISKPFTEEFALGNNQRLVVTYSPDRARKDSADRERAVAKLKGKLKGKLKSNKASTASLINNHAAKKYLREEVAGRSILDESKVEEDTKWDGIFGIATNDKSLTAERVVSIYKSLWNIEAAFRLSKHDLKMRPIYHWSSDRIKAHCAICFLTYTLARHLEYRISIQQKAMSFAKIQEALLGVQASVLRHIKTKKLYRVPSNISNTAKKIYAAFSIKRSVVPTQIIR
jgi:transposase